MKIDLKNIDKSNWKTYRFDQIAHSISERVEPGETDLAIYVGLEHLDSEDIHIRRFGKPSDVSGQKLKCYPGDVIFGKRRAYQRKAAVVDFEGICSAHAFVLRANPKVIDPLLFPFFLHSDTFMHRAIDISVGGLSPTINWGDLKGQEFLLPPKEQQAQLAELLWAMDEVSEKQAVLSEKLQIQLETTIENEIHGIRLKGKRISDILFELKEDGNLVYLSSLGEFLKGKGISKSEVRDIGYPAIRYGELYTNHYRVVREFKSFIDNDSKKESIKLLQNDLILAGSGETITDIGRSAAFVDNFEAYVGGDTIVFRPTNQNGYYLGYLMNSKLVRHQLNKYGTGATVMHIYISDLQKVKVLDISIEIQNQIAGKLEAIYNNCVVINKMKNGSSILYRNILNQIF